MTGEKQMYTTRIWNVRVMNLNIRSDKNDIFLFDFLMILGGIKVKCFTVLVEVTYIYFSEKPRFST